MKINIGKHDCTELWDKVLYKALSDYPNVTDNEINVWEWSEKVYSFVKAL